MTNRTRRTTAWFARLKGLWLVALLCTAAAASDHPVVPGFARFHAGSKSADPAAGGRLLLSELNCAACHSDLPVTTTRTAPNLQDVGQRLRPEAIMRIIREPHAVKPGALMPAMLNNLPESERNAAAEALTHFLVGEQAIVDTPPVGVAAGEKLFHEAGCIACHQSRRPGAQPLETSVPLEFVEAKYTVGSLAAFLRNPHAVRPSGRMPNLSLTDDESKQLAGYLLKDLDVPANLAFRYYEGTWDKLPDFDSLAPVASGAATGFDVSVGNRRDDFGLVFEGYLQIRRAGDYAFELASDDGSRLLIDGEKVIENDGIHGMQMKPGKARLSAGPHKLRVEFFERGGGEELEVRISGPGLDKQEMAGLVTSTQDPVEADRFQVKPALARVGSSLFRTQGCASCHNIERQGEKFARSDARTPLRSLTSGCLATNPPGSVPNFALSGAQRTAITEAIRQGAPKDETPEQSIARTMLTFNCYTCHSRGGVGGPERAREAAFLTKIPEMGDEGRIPPPLDGVGDKLNEAWLKHVMDNGANDRPYMLTRMPKFGQQQVGELIPALVDVDQKTEVAAITFSDPVHRVRSAGRHMMGDQSPLSCTKCHYFGKYAATGIQAMDLQTMTQRLRRDWFHRYLANPQVYRAGTRMPAAWPNGRSIVPDVLDGRPATQMEAIWLYLEQGKDAPIPSGLVPGRMELKPTTEPIIYRNFITSLSPRGIAVGYPEQAHIAWDATDMSLALIWHNAFIDAAKHWVGRGQGTQEPLGDNRFSLVRGVPIMRLSNPSSQPWPDAGENARFRGYRLNKKGQPAFRYSIGTARVSDFIRPVSSKPFSWLERTLTVNADQDQTDWFFRAASGKSIRKVDDNRYVIDEGVEMQFPDTAVMVRDIGGRQELLVPLRFVNGTATVTQQIRW